MLNGQSIYMIVKINSFISNYRIIELAYTSTLKRLRERHHVYSEKLGSFGLPMRSREEIEELEKKNLEI